MEDQRRKAIRENFFVDQLMTAQGPKHDSYRSYAKNGRKNEITWPRVR